MAAQGNEKSARPAPAGARNRRVSSKDGGDRREPSGGPRNSAAGGSKPGASASKSGSSSKSPRGSLVSGAGATKAEKKKGSGAAAVGAIVGMLVGAGGIGALSWASGCGERAVGKPRIAAPAASESAAASMAQVDVPPAPDDSNEPEVAEPDAPDAKPDVDKPWAGPWLDAVAQVTPIYPTARFSRNRLGYLRRGGKAPVIDKPIHTDACKGGFYPLVDGGYVCAKYATTDIEDSRVKMGIKAPNLESDLPYQYAYNTSHGTPLYIQVPSRDDMLRYEPYLKERPKKHKTKEDEPDKAVEKADQPHPDDAPAPAPSADPSASAAARPAPPPAPSAAASADPDAGVPEADEPDAGDKPWWQQGKDKPLDIKLSDLEEGDGTIAKRMVKGFFVAVDRTFSWNNRLWYKTTDGLIAPSDRMIIPKAPELKGFEMGDGVKQVGFVRVPHAFKYEKAKDGKSFVKKGKVERYSSYALSGTTELDNRQRYYQTADGWWLREADGTITEPGPRPDRVAADEKWIDVNLSHKTLVALIGDKPMFAALISSGKTSAVKEKDHRTKTGIFRIREKHVSTTMDGDGAAAGDLPYSIMDVPYVEYYDGSFALHAAFWHNNFGREQSHGCVNLSPKDAKWLFFWTEPMLPRGWHGVWASDKRKGTWVVIHE